MSVLDLLYDRQQWLEYIDYKESSGNVSAQELEELKNFVSQKDYLDVDVSDGAKFGIPAKKYISKLGSEKKRVVYTFSAEKSMLLKLLTYLLIRKYDDIFASNLYSFRASRGVWNAIQRLKHMPKLKEMYVYKVDISNYFNSVDIEKLDRMLKPVLQSDPEAYHFIMGILNNPNVQLPDGSIIQEKKGIMAGVPISAFLANLYLSELDWEFREIGIQYARYSDDIIIFARSAEQRQNAISIINSHLAEKGLTINQKKVKYTEPGESWDFLGISYKEGIFDVSEISARKLKGKMRRKSRALLRWCHCKNVPNEKAAKAFIRVMNRKLFENHQDSDLTWTRWFFPLINTSSTLEQIDHYMQDCIRNIATEKHNKSRYNCRYQDIKRLGYRSLIHEYYSIKKKTLNES